MSKKLVYGVGVNDADYAVVNHEYFVEAGVRKRKVTWKCEYYSRWYNMLSRCYNEKHLINYPTYSDCVVCDEWLTFSNFKAWMKTQDWVGKFLDKDILVHGNKVYSPDTCIFISGKLNNFVLSKTNKTYIGTTGVYFDKDRGKFCAECQDPLKQQGKFVGLFSTAEEAHHAWKSRKHQYACMLADLQDDPRVADALRKRYL